MKRGFVLTALLCLAFLANCESPGGGTAPGSNDGSSVKTAVELQTAIQAVKSGESGVITLGASISTNRIDIADNRKITLYTGGYNINVSTLYTSGGSNFVIAKSKEEPAAFQKSSKDEIDADGVNSYRQYPGITISALLSVKGVISLTGSTRLEVEGSSAPAKIDMSGAGYILTDKTSIVIIGLLAETADNTSLSIEGEACWIMDVTGKAKVNSGTTGGPVKAGNVASNEERENPPSPINSLEEFLAQPGGGAGVYRIKAQGSILGETLGTGANKTLLGTAVVPAQLFLTAASSSSISGMVIVEADGTFKEDRGTEPLGSVLTAESAKISVAALASYVSGGFTVIGKDDSAWIKLTKGSVSLVKETDGKIVFDFAAGSEAEIPYGKTLDIGSDYELRLGENALLTAKGTVRMAGALSGNGSIVTLSGGVFVNSRTGGSPSQSDLWKVDSGAKIELEAGARAQLAGISSAFAGPDDNALIKLTGGKIVMSKEPGATGSVTFVFDKKDGAAAHAEITSGSTAAFVQGQQAILKDGTELVVKGSLSVEAGAFIKAAKGSTLNMPYAESNLLQGEIHVKGVVNDLPPQQWAKPQSPAGTVSVFWDDANSNGALVFYSGSEGRINGAPAENFQALSIGGKATLALLKPISNPFNAETQYIVSYHDTDSSTSITTKNVLIKSSAACATGTFTNGLVNDVTGNALTDDSVQKLKAGGFNGVYYYLGTNNVRTINYFDDF